MNRTLIPILTTTALVVLSFGSAEARHRGVRGEARLAETAHVLESRSEHLARFASRFADPWSPRERRLVRDLDRLAFEARTFHAVVERPGLRIGQTERALDDLLYAYDRAGRTLSRVRMPRVVYGKFDRLGELIEASARQTVRLARSSYHPRPIRREFRVYARFADDDLDHRRFDGAARYARPVRIDDDDDRDDDFDDRRGRRARRGDD